MDTQQKLDKLQQIIIGGREDAQAEVAAMKRTLKSALLKKNLAEHPALIQLLNLLTKREERITTILSDKEDMTDSERRGFIEARKEVRFIISFFQVDERIQALDNRLDYLLSDEVDNVLEQ